MNGLIWVLGGAVCCAASGSLSHAQPVPESKGRQLVDPGPIDVPVNEPVIAFQNTDTVGPTLMVMWQVQDVPGPGEVEAPLRFEYATAVFDNVQDRWVFTDRGAVPAPLEIMEHFDPTLAAGIKTGTNSARYTGAGAGRVFDQSQQIVENAFLLRTDPSDPLEFDPLLSEWLDECIVRYTKLRAVEVGAATLSTTMHLLSTIVDFESVCGESGQVLLRRSVNNGVSWSNWLPVVDEHGPVIGFPSKPVLVVDIQVIGGAQSYFSYLDEQASYIRIARADDAAVPAWSDAGLNVTPTLPIGMGQTYFDAAKTYVAGEFEIGPFTSMAVAPDGETMYVVYHDLAGPPQGNDGDFDIYIARRLFNEQTSQYEWKAPKKVNLDAPHVRSDQFMPVMEIESDGRIHIAWYDTRGDLRAPGQDVTISLFYAWSDDQGETFTEIQLDDQIIKTEELSNPKFIGDGLDMAFSGTSLLISAMGTSHVRVYPGPPDYEQQMLGGFIPGGPGQPVQENEAIYIYRVDW